MTWAWSAVSVFGVAGAVVIFLFGALIARVRPRTRAAAWVAAFAVSFGLATGLINLLLVDPDAGPSTDLMAAVAGFATVATATCLLAMWMYLPDRVQLPWTSYVVPLAMLAIGLFLWTFPLLLGWIQSSTASAFPRPALLYFAGHGLQAGAWWGLLWLLCVRHARAGSPQGEPLLAAALVLYPASDVKYVFSPDLAIATFAWVSLGLALTTAAAWLVAGHRSGRIRPARNVAWFVLAVCLVAILEGADSGGTLGEGLGINGIARIATVGLLGYAVVRHHVLGLDVKVRWTISKSTVAAVFVGVFFAASEMAQQFFGAQFNSEYLGIAAAGLLVVAIAPIQRLADQLATKAIPTAPGPGPAPEAFYREQVETAWADGRISANEKVMLRKMRASLGLSAEAAEAIELEAATRAAQRKEGDA